MKINDLTPLFIFEMANNHMGSVEHGLKIIRAVAEVCRPMPWKFAFKFQYRDLDTFIHPDYRNSAEYKYIKRFQETRLSPDEFKRMKDEADRLGFVSVCTPFDEASVDLIEKHGIDIIKIASCSFTDWPLLERISKTAKPLIASTAGEKLENIDNVVSFWQHRGRDLALMHCVAAYPTAPADLQLNQIDLFRTRYPQVTIGFSTHEAPDNTQAIRLAVAKGAAVFEKHVGLEADGIKLNAYSANPAQVAAWLTAAREAFDMCGVAGARYTPGEAEVSSLLGLRRGVFARKPIAAGRRIAPADLFLAIPTQPGQVTANDMSKYAEFFAEQPIGENAPVLASAVRSVNNRRKIYDIIQAVKQVLKDSRLAVPSQVDMEISHHYGIDRFAEFGITMLQVVNREYCKKLLVLLPRQVHPEQYHQVKEETFHILYGDVYITLNGQETLYRSGDVVTAERGVRHAMRSETGVVIEEISTTHMVQDSFYTDPAIVANPSRKTLVTHWMR
jgi:sialic acid synthase SpsE/quercetin dioxygenase-like cupin family protein